MKKTFWLLPVLLAVPLFAVVPQFWETRTNDDFRNGKFSNLSLTSDDELVLAPRFDVVFNTEQTLIWSAVSDSKGNVYLGTGHDGKIFKVTPDGKGSLLTDLPELDVLALAVDNKNVLYAGTSPDGKVYRIGSDGIPKEFYNPKSKYIWSLVFDKHGQLFVGTGDRGVIYRVDPEGKGEAFYDTEETHVVCMAIDNDGNLIAGGDPKAYVYRISPEGKAFVLYDSGMHEVHSVAVAPDGSIYASVLNEQTPLPPGSGSSPSTSDLGKSGSQTTVSVTLDPDSAAAQNIEVIEPLGQGSSATPRIQTSRRSGSDANAQSAVLEILSNGIVNTLWQSPDEMVFSVLPHAGKVLFSTGTKGRIYSIDSSENATLILQSTEEQTTRLLGVENRLYAASSNVGKLFRIGEALAPSGTYESIVKDTDSISTWGKISWKGEHQDSIQIFTRTGNTSVPDRTWSDWETMDAESNITSPKARFIQWKATLKADGTTSPRLGAVTVPYLQQNFRPEVTKVDVLPSGVALVRIPTVTSTNLNPNDAAAARANARAGRAPARQIPPRRLPQKGAQSFQWTARDKNEDRLIYDLYYRGENERMWKVLKKGLDENFYTINSDTLPDGIYIVRVVASDEPSNPADMSLEGELESRPVSIDNTPPVVHMKLEGIDNGRTEVAIDAVDQTSTLSQAEVSIDAGDWQPIFPQDGIMDSKSESFRFRSDILNEGEHVIAFRVYDQNDNAGLGKLVVRMP